MTWFWMNHFSVFSGRQPALDDRGVREAIRSHAFDRFSDLVMATVTSPAMLEYLDNAQSATGRSTKTTRASSWNCTLGVSGGPSGSTYHSRTCRSWPGSSPAPASTCSGAAA
jgi:hypothetical protein